MDANHPNHRGMPTSTLAWAKPAPGVWQAIGLIALYFALQLSVGGVIAIAAGLVEWVRHGGEVAAVFSMGRHWLGASDASAIAVMLTLLVSATVMLRLIGRWWPGLMRQSTLPGFGFARSRHAGMYVLALGFGLVMPLIGGMLTQWLAQGHQVSQDIKQLGTNISLPLRLPLAVLVISLGPLVEEALFRGVLLSSCARSLGSGWAVVLTAVLFACVHLPDLGFLWYALPNLALLGLGLGWLRVASGSIWPARYFRRAIASIFLRLSRNTSTFSLPSPSK